MTTVAIVADVHVGNHKVFGGETRSGINERCRLVLDVLKRAVTLSPDPTAGSAHQSFVVLGDLLDSARATPQVLGATMEALGSSDASLVIGNHEITSFDVNDHGLFPFMFSEGLVVHDQPSTHYAKGVIVPYREASMDWVQAGYDAALVKWSGAGRSPPQSYGAKWVGIHAGISDIDTPPFLSGIPAKDLLKFAQKEDVRVFAGDWHSPRSWDAYRVMQCGALCPTGFDNPGMDYGRLWIYDTSGDYVDYVVIPGPRFLSYTYAEIAKPDALLTELDAWNVGTAKAPGYTIFVKIKAQPDEMAKAVDMAKELRTWPYIGGVRVEPDGEVLHRRARSAAAAARSGSSLKDALKQYLKHMDVPEGVSRKAVGRLVREYLNI